MSECRIYGRYSTVWSSAVITNKQFLELQELAVEAGVTAEQICKAYKIDGVTKLPASKYEAAVKKLRATIAEKPKPDAPAVRQSAMLSGSTPPTG